MTNNISFSIVVVNYNMGKYLEDALLSVIHQDYPKELIQLIVIDGGSKDQSVEIIRKHSDFINYWISEPDKGQSDAFNKGFKQSKHEWLFWLNADDFLLKDALKNIALAMKKELRKDSTKQWFCFDSLMTDEKGICNKAIYGPQWNDFYMKKIGPVVHSATTIFHKELYENSQKFDLQLYWSMDLDLWLQFFTMGYSYKTLHIFAYAIRANEQSKTFSEGLKYKPSAERIRQSAYMWSKYIFRPNRKWITAWRIHKAFTISIPLIYHNLRFNKKHQIWWPIK
jgi:glycosyltransferase involved in cell wall biosynthesis